MLKFDLEEVCNISLGLSIGIEDEEQAKSWFCSGLL
jgi:hypothetical protein